MRVYYGGRTADVARLAAEIKGAFGIGRMPVHRRRNPAGLQRQHRARHLNGPRRPKGIANRALERHRRYPARSRSKYVAKGSGLRPVDLRVSRPPRIDEIN